MRVPVTSSTLLSLSCSQPAAVAAEAEASPLLLLHRHPCRRPRRTQRRPWYRRLPRPKPVA